MEAKGKRLTKAKLASTLGISQATLWRAIDANTKKAKRLKLAKCPKHQLYPGGRKYYIAEEVQAWLDMISNYETK